MGNMSINIRVLQVDIKHKLFHFTIMASVNKIISIGNIFNKMTVFFVTKYLKFALYFLS